MRRLSILLVPVALLIGSPLNAAQPAREGRPNILIILADDLGYADVGFHGSTDIVTPNLDALAASGVRCSQGYVSSPLCSPSRAGLMTGRYAQRFGHEFNPFRPPHGLPVTEPTLADRLKKAGYVTGLIGKWHLGSQPQFHPQQRGFDEFFGFLGGAHDYFDSQQIFQGQARVQEKEYLTDALAREAVAFVERHKSQPWFLFLSFNAVHTPTQADQARLDKFSNIADPKRRTYAAMALAMDQGVGLLRSSLVDAGIADNTLVIFLSDHGGPTMPGTTINGSRNTPLRGSKRTTLEGGIRVPMVVAWPARLKPAVFDQPVTQLDLHATALAAAGAPHVAEDPLDGLNLLPFLTGHQTGAPHEALYWRIGPQMAIREGDYKLVRYDQNADTQSGKLDEPVTSPRLYRLSDDMGESKDLAASMPEKVRHLQAKWDRWNATLAAPAWEDGRLLSPERDTPGLYASAPPSLAVAGLRRP